MAPPRPLPTVRLRRLAGELRRLREAAELTREAVCEQTGINEATLYRLETGRARPQRRTLLSLLAVYGVSGPERDALAELARNDQTAGWLQPRYADLPEQLSAYMAFEAEAAAVRNYEAAFVPGLLQTEAYARAVVRGVLPEATDDEIEQRVRARLERQALLTKPNPLRLWAIIDEAALRRMVGGPKVMHEQLQRLVEISSAPYVTMQLIPFAAGAHPGMPGSFVVMSFADPADPEIVYLDSMAGDLFVEVDDDIRRFGGVFDHLRAAALSPHDSRRFIERMDLEAAQQ
jgi:transcriptional regulator with XRE-family HTH domain